MRMLQRRDAAWERAPNSLRKSCVRATLIMTFCIMFGSSCGPSKDDDGSVGAYRSTRRNQLVGGSAALAEVGDFILENDHVRVAILQPGNSVGPGVFGGSLIDADLKRPQAEYQGGRGVDQFAEMFPSVNLLVPNPRFNEVVTGPDWAGPPEVSPEKTCPAIWPSDKNGEPLKRGDFAAVCASGVGDNYLDALSLLGVFLTETFFQTDYILKKGARYVEVVTSIEAGDGDRSVIRPMCPFRRGDDLGHEPQSVLEAIVGTETHESGLLSGDFLLFGRRLDVFVPGLGFNEESHITETLLRGGDTLNNPVAFPYMAGIGDKISYALVSERTRAEDPWGVCGDNQEEPSKLLVPIETGAFTFVFTHWWRCPVGSTGCQGGGRLFYRRYFILGEGDVASILDIAHKIWDEPVGTLHGVIYDGNTGKAVPESKVFVLMDPVASEWSSHFPEASHSLCDSLRGAQGDAVSFETLESCARKASVSVDYETGYLGVVNEILSDRGDDPVKDGVFKATLPPGTYYLVGLKEGRNPSDAQRVVIREGEKKGVGVPLLPKGRVIYDVRDERGERTPAKITIIGDCLDAQGRDVCDCFPATDPSCAGDGIPESDRQILEFGGMRLKGGVVKILRTITGQGEFSLPPGRYRFIFSRGAERSIDEHVRVVPDDGRAISLDAQVQRVVDTTGWITSDFHVHSSFSYDAVPDLKTRIGSFLAEGIELLSSSDHDWITDYHPTLRELGVEKWLRTQVGLETTTVEIGHWLGWPLVFDDTAPENGAIDWTGLTPAQIHTAIRSRGLYGPDDTVVTVAHPRETIFGYYDQFGMSPFDLTLKPGMLQSPNPILKNSDNFDPFADAIEVINGKRYDMIRTPTNEEVRKYNKCVEYLYGFIDELPEDFLEGECDPTWTQDQASSYWARRVLERTPAESAAYRFHHDIGRECFTDATCERLGLVDHYCNGNTGLCSAPKDCSGDGDCDSGRCDTGSGVCYLDSECDPKEAGSVCGTGLLCDPVHSRCVEPCSSHRDCHPGHRCCKFEDCGCNGAACDEGDDDLSGSGVCVEAKCRVNDLWETTGIGGARPCVDWQGVAEDWFRLLNHGVVYTAIGNSDTHTTTKNEPGMAHNYICSSVDRPSDIDLLELARNVKDGCVVVSYGPFLEMWANGERVGSKVKASPPADVALRIRVQSPAWFDVDRVEVYRNGSLKWIFKGTEEGDLCNGPQSEWPCVYEEPEPGFQVRVCDCIPLENGHNVDVVNMDITFGDAPQRDSWYVATAMASGTGARTMSPINTWRYYPNISFGIIVNKALSSFDIGIDIGSYVEPTPPTAQVSPVVPYAITNPVWVDRTGAPDDAFSFEPLGPSPDWMIRAMQKSGMKRDGFFDVESSSIMDMRRRKVHHRQGMRRADIEAFLRGGVQRLLTDKNQLPK